MEIADRTVVVTGGGRGIGAATATAFARAGAKVVVADLARDLADQTVAAIRDKGGIADAIAADVGLERDVAAIVDFAVRTHGTVDIFCSNAGVLRQGGPDAPDADWDLSWRVNVMAHVYAARACLPLMIGNGGGYLVNVSSAAGLLTALGAAPYATTKHAAVAFAEWLAITYADRGIKVSVVCPQTVDTAMLAATLVGEAASSAASAGRVITAEAAAEAVLEGIRQEALYILPHPEVARYYRQKADDPERWQRGMRKFVAGTRA